MQLKEILKLKFEEYIAEIEKTNISAAKGDGRYIWIKHEFFSTVRFPDFITTKPSKVELNTIFKKMNCALLNFTIIPSDKDLVNSVIYICNKYNFENLSKNVRRDIKFGQRNLIYGFVNWDEILYRGLKAFSDTRTRVGLSDGDEKSFQKRFSLFSKNPGHIAVAAWLDQEIIAFMSLIVVEDFVMIQGSFSTDEHKKYCPNNVLVDFVLNFFLNDSSFKTVCYGLSSIQETSNNEGLNQYKIRVGFDTIPVQRVFLLNKFLKPFRGLIKWILRLLKFVLPKNRILRKASGVLKYLD